MCSVHCLGEMICSLTRNLKSFSEKCVGNVKWESLQLYKVDECALKADMGEKRKQHLFPDL